MQNVQHIFETPEMVMISVIIFLTLCYLRKRVISYPSRAIKSVYITYLGTYYKLYIYVQYLVFNFNNNSNDTNNCKTRGKFESPNTTPQTPFSCIEHGLSWVICDVSK